MLYFLKSGSQTLQLGSFTHFERRCKYRELYNPACSITIKQIGTETEDDQNQS